MVADFIGHVLELFPVVPDLVEPAEKTRGHRGARKLVDDVGQRIALLVAEIDGGEPLDREIDRGLRAIRPGAGQLLHRRAGRVRAEPDLATDPVGALPGDGPLERVDVVDEFHSRANTGAEAEPLQARS